MISKIFNKPLICEKCPCLATYWMPLCLDGWTWRGTFNDYGNVYFCATHKPKLFIDGLNGLKMRQDIVKIGFWTHYRRFICPIDKWILVDRKFWESKYDFVGPKFNK